METEGVTDERTKGRATAPETTGPEGSVPQQLVPEIRAHARRLEELRREVGKVIVGQSYMIERLILALIAEGHVLLEGIPGLAKTTAVKTLARAIDTSFSRVSFTPDLLPADLLGTEIYQPRDGGFVVKRGPIFTNLLLADEINRAPAKVQSALLEAMEEHQVTLGDTSHALPDPFLVLATQNPIEQEGTYPLPEAQIDRFMLKLKVGYPERREEREIMRRMARRNRPTVEAVLNPGEIRTMREVADRVYMDPKVEDYVLDVVSATREPSSFGLERLERLIDYGASPRASIYLAQVAKVHAFMAGRAYVTPQDVKTLGPDVLRHRVLVSYEAEAQDLSSDHLLTEIFSTLDVP